MGILSKIFGGNENVSPNGNRTNSTSQAEDFYKTGVSYTNDKQYDKAVASYTSAITINPNHVEAYICRAEAYICLDDYERATSDLEKAISLNPKHMRALGLSILNYDGDDYDFLIGRITQFLSIDPENIIGYSFRGLAYYHKKQYDKSITDLTKAITISANDDTIFYNRGRSYIEIQEFQKAIHDFNKAISLQPNESKYFKVRGFAYVELKDFESALNDMKQSCKLGDSEACECIEVISRIQQKSKA